MYPTEPNTLLNNKFHTGLDKIFISISTEPLLIIKFDLKVLHVGIEYAPENHDKQGYIGKSE